MQRTSFADWPCSVARVLEIIGDPWTPLVLRDAYHGLTRFDEFQRSLGIARNTLADRLRRLVEGGMLRTEQYQANPPRSEYVLTEMGADFMPAMAAMLSWGDRWLAGPEGAPVTLTHTTCGHDGEATVVCGHCQAPLGLGDTTFSLGPGYPDEVPAGVPDLREQFRARWPEPEDRASA
jgi:DNA-binding HxlR family transcriptional regulator